jgi:hypothetical protein
LVFTRYEARWAPKSVWTLGIELPAVQSVAVPTELPRILKAEETDEKEDNLSHRNSDS